jgi:hypothetical protein
LPAKANGAAPNALVSPRLHQPGQAPGVSFPHSNTKTLTPGKSKIMAIVLETNYSKKLGLPGFSSHAFSLAVRTEVADLSQVAADSARLYTLLQTSVDREIQKTGFLPANNGNGNGHPLSPGTPAKGKGAGAWACSPKQKRLILKIVEEHKLDKEEVDGLAQDRFGKPVRALSKPEASGLIDELTTQTRGIPNGN